MTEPIKFRVGASFKRRSGKFAANPSVLGYVRMAGAKEKAPALHDASRGHSSWGPGTTPLDASTIIYYARVDLPLGTA
jgi:hypothetical protein